jgi:hypothetical protein
MLSKRTITAGGIFAAASVAYAKSSIFAKAADREMDLSTSWSFADGLVVNGIHTHPVVKYIVMADRELDDLDRIHSDEYKMDDSLKRVMAREFAPQITKANDLARQYPKAHTVLHIYSAGVCTIHISMEIPGRRFKLS